MSLERWGWYSAGVNVVLAMAHGIIALISGSLAVTAELVHNAADLLTAIAVIVGLRLATRKSDAFPYGLYKVENLAAIALALVIFLTAYEIAREALFTSRSPVDVAPWMFPVIAATLAIPLVFSHFELRTARMADSPSLMR
jgi:divalent metal cation (Fe/Co/Zn/Cd) transporter